MERATGIEPAYQPWQGRVLPLNYARISQASIIIYSFFVIASIFLKNVNFFENF